MTEEFSLKSKLHNALQKLMELSGENVALKAENPLLKKQLGDQWQRESSVLEQSQTYPSRINEQCPEKILTFKQ